MNKLQTKYPNIYLELGRCLLSSPLSGSLAPTAKLLLVSKKLVRLLNQTFEHQLSGDILEGCSSGIYHPKQLLLTPSAKSDSSKIGLINIASWGSVKYN